MKKLLIIFGVMLTGCGGTESIERTEPVDLVSILVGTESRFELSTGNTYPAVAMPWGMNFWTPQTGKMGDGWAYKYTTDRIRGFKQTHQPSPWINDYGQFSIMPFASQSVDVQPGVTTTLFDQESRASWFSHKAETAKPYYYSVYLADHDVMTELTPTERAAFFRFTFPERDCSFVVVDAFDKGSAVKISTDGRRISGYSTKNSGGVPENFRNYFVVEFDRPFTYTATTVDGVQTQNTEAQGDHTMAVVGFPTSKGDVVHVRVASSFIGEEQALVNLRELAPTFDETAAKGRARWNEILGRIDVVDENVDNLRTFYSCLYRSVLFPRDFSEIDASGNRVHYSPYNGKVEAGEMFTDTGFWDTFRSLFPLVNLVYPDMGARMQAGLVNAYKESGFLPEWASPGHRDCMIGNNSASVVADAWLGGLRGYDVETLWEAVTNGANAEHPTIGSTGRKGFKYYNELGYVPYDAGIHENAARTLEYAYDDWCIYQLGKALGKSEEEIAPYKLRAQNYRNVFDAETKLMRGRLQNGQFQSPFNPLKWGDAFTEGNSLHYTWSVFHDPAGLISLMGGPEVFNSQMDGVFNMPPKFDDSYYGFPIHEIREMQIMNMGNYAHGNQPIQHMIYLYNWSGQPWKAQARVREVMNKLYTAAPDGYCGDEDNGQTSAWYVFSALGFYPVCPGSGQYAVGSPLFDRVTVTPAGGKPFTVATTGNGAYIGGAKLNGREWTRNYVTHEALTSGAKLDFRMTETADTKRGTVPEDAPRSMSLEE